MGQSTVQITLSAGDISYAQMTVPALANAHRSSAKEIVVLVDCCRPQATRVMNPEEKFPEPRFSERVSQIVDIAHDLKDNGVVDRVVLLRQDSPIIPLLRKKYLANRVQGTHDFRGFGMMSYFAGIEIASTRFVAHYDADILLYQEAGYDWVTDCIQRLARYSEAVAAYPRDSPPSTEDPPQTVAEGGWKSYWFNSQCYLVDKYKLDKMLPLISRATLFQHLIFKYVQRATPKSPEMLMRRRMRNRRFWSLKSESFKSWTLHPVDKSADFVKILPGILRHVEANDVPDRQLGGITVDMQAWNAFLGKVPA